MQGHNQGAKTEEKRQSFGEKVKEEGSEAGENLSQTIKHNTEILGDKAKSMARQVSSGMDKTSYEIHHIDRNIDSVKKSLGGVNATQAKVNAGSAFYETKNSIEHTGSQMMKDSQRQGSKLMNSGNNGNKI